MRGAGLLGLGCHDPDIVRQGARDFLRGGQSRRVNTVIVRHQDAHATALLRTSYESDFLFSNTLPKNFRSSRLDSKPLPKFAPNDLISLTPMLWQYNCSAFFSLFVALSFDASFADL